MAAIGPEMQKYLWWKKYLTILQMVQFCVVLIHTAQLLFYNPCNYPLAFVYWIIAHSAMFLALFANFYRQAYIEKRNRKDKLEDAAREAIDNNANEIRLRKRKVES
jgi:phosphatidylglycerophosphate synthase